MATKLVSLTEEAYERLDGKKTSGESFSDVVLRLTGKIKLTDFAGILTEEEAAKIEKKVKDLRAKSRGRANRIKEEIRA